MSFDYRPAIESAKINPGYREKFAAFVLYRGHDSISISPSDSTVRVIHYDLDADTNALNEELNRLRDAVIRTLPD